MSNIAAHPRPGNEPPVVIDAALMPQLEDLALAAREHMPEVALRLLYELGRASVVPSDRMPQEVVSLGSLVTWRDESAGRDQTVCLVLPQQADIEFGRVSILTPIGVALLGLAEGARIEWRTRTGEVRRMKILKVDNPEAESPPPAAA